jgi:hypothetical protein
MHPLRHVGHGNHRAAEVDLQLPARRRLEPHRCEGFGAQLPPQRLRRALHPAQAHVHDQLPLQTLAHDVGVAAVLTQALARPCQMRLLRAAPVPAAGRSPAATQLPADPLAFPTKR